MLRNNFSGVSVYIFLVYYSIKTNFASSRGVGYFQKILSIIGLWSEKVVKVCSERYCIKFVSKMFSEAKTKSTVLQRLYPV